MSGGSMNYAYHHLNDIADYVEDKEIKDLITDLSELIHDLEWWDSGDISKKGYEETLFKFKQKWFGDKRNERLEEYITESLDNMKWEIKKLLGT